MADQLTPTRAESTFLDVPSGPIAALDTGGAGPVLLLVPGYTGSKEDFAPVLDPLADNGIRAVAIDLPGQYQSGGPESEAFYRPESLGPVLAGVIAGLGGRVVLLGHSYGGLVSRAAVLAGAPVAGLVLLCSGPAAFTGGSRLDALLIGGPLLRQHGLAAAYAIRESTTEGLRGAPPAELAAFLRRRFLQTSAPSLLGMASALIDEPDRTHDLALNLQNRPVAVVSGESDDAWPHEQQRAMAAGLGTSLVLIPGAAHSPASRGADRPGRPAGTAGAHLDGCVTGGTDRRSAPPGEPEQDQHPDDHRDRADQPGGGR